MKPTFDNLRRAHWSVLPLGVKPEDYYFADPELPLKLARVIAQEARRPSRRRRRPRWGLALLFILRERRASIVSALTRRSS